MKPPTRWFLWLTQRTIYDETAGDRHLMTEEQFQNERIARDKRGRELLDRHYRRALCDPR